MLKTRVITAAILIPFILGSVYIGGLVFWVMMTLAMLLASWEFFQMTSHIGQRPIVPLGLALVMAFALNAWFKTSYEREIIVLAIVISMAAALFRHHENWLTSWAVTITGVLYIGGLGAYAILVRNLENGLVWTYVALVTIWATDAGAYIAGTTIGRHKFFPDISPKKTWEGAIAGCLAATIAMIGFALTFRLPLIEFTLFGFGLGIAGIIGDLAESLLKRQTGVKDSGTIMPGHGGVLDRIDSLLFAAVFTYYFVTLVLHL